MSDAPQHLEQHPAESPFHARLAIGERMDATALTDGLPWAFEHVTMRPLEPMLMPEHPRGGEVDPQNCSSCKPSEHTIWHDDLWQVRAGWDAGGLPLPRRDLAS